MPCSVVPCEYQARDVFAQHTPSQFQSSTLPTDAYFLILHILPDYPPRPNTNNFLAPSYHKVRSCRFPVLLSLHNQQVHMSEDILNDRIPATSLTLLPGNKRPAEYDHNSEGEQRSNAGEIKPCY